MVADISVNEKIEYFTDPRDYQVKYLTDVATGKGLTLPEAYMKNRLHICFLFDKLSCATNITIRKMQVNANNGSRLRSEAKSTITGNANRGVKTVKIGNRKFRDLTDGNYEAVFVGYIKGMESVQDFVPARIGLEGMHNLDDTYSGKLYTSGINGAIKAFLPPTKGKLNSFGLWGFVVHHAKYNDVEGRSQIMDGISDQKWKLSWDGLLGFNEVGALSSLWIITDPQLERQLRQIGINLPLQFSDVMFGPLNF